MNRSEENYEPEVYIIPVNISDNGYAIWIIKKRNLIETLVLGFLAFLVWRLIFSPFGYIAELISFVLLVLPVIIFSLTGIKGESLLEFVIEYVFYLKKKRRMLFRIPREAQERQSRFIFKRDRKKASRAEKKDDRLRLKEQKRREKTHLKESRKKEKLDKKSKRAIE